VQGAGKLVPLLRPFPANAMRVYPVGMTVNKPRNGGPECLTAVERPATPRGAFLLDAGRPAREKRGRGAAGHDPKH
jgi:hypothetical protein